MASVGGGEARSSAAAWLRDVLRFPYRKFEIDTELSQAEVVERLRGIVEPGSAFRSWFRRTNKLFAGDVSPASFKVRTLKFYPIVYSPVVIGRLEPLPIGTRVRVVMRLRRFTQVFILFWFAAMVFSCVTPFFVATPSAKNGANFFTLFTPLEWIGLVTGGVSFAFLVVAVSFGIEARKASGLLEEALRPEPGPRVQKVFDNARSRLPMVARILLACAALEIVLIVGAQSIIARSEPYHVAESYVQSDLSIRSELGAVGEVDLDRWKSARLRWGNEGNAMFALRVEGSRGKGTVFIEMKRHHGAWRVTAANLREADGRVIQLQGDAAGAIVPGP